MFSLFPTGFELARAYAKSGGSEPVGQFNLGLSIVMKDHIKITFGDGSYLQIRPEHIYPLTEEGYDVIVIQGDAMLQTSTPGSWCGFKDLKIRLVPYGPPKENTPEEKPESSSVLTKFKEIFAKEPKFTLLPSTRRYNIPEWWSKIPTLSEEPGYARTDSSRHQRLLETLQWPIENFDYVKTLRINRDVTMITETKS